MDQTLRGFYPGFNVTSPGQGAVQTRSRGGRSLLRGKCVNIRRHAASCDEPAAKDGKGKHRYLSLHSKAHSQKKASGLGAFDQGTLLQSIAGLSPRPVAATPAPASCSARVPPGGVPMQSQGLRVSHLGSLGAFKATLNPKP